MTDYAFQNMNIQLWYPALVSNPREARGMQNIQDMPTTPVCTLQGIWYRGNANICKTKKEGKNEKRNGQPKHRRTVVATKISHNAAQT
jgi:hypothetical protein